MQRSGLLLFNTLDFIRVKDRFRGEKPILASEIFNIFITDSISAAALLSATFVKLFTHIFVCHQAVEFGIVVGSNQAGTLFMILQFRLVSFQTATESKMQCSPIQMARSLGIYICKVFINSFTQLMHNRCASMYGESDNDNGKRCNDISACEFLWTRRTCDYV